MIPLQHFGRKTASSCDAQHSRVLIRRMVHYPVSSGSGVGLRDADLVNIVQDRQPRASFLSLRLVANYPEQLEAMIVLLR